MSIPDIAAYALADIAPSVPDKVGWALEPGRAALLIHDMQRYFVDFYGEDSALAAELVGNVRRLKMRCVARGIPVIYTAQPAVQPPAERGLLTDMWGPGLTRADPSLAAIVPALAPAPDDLVLTKWRYSAFQRSPLEERMRAWGRDQLLICGVYAHIGCLTTALDAFMRDIQPFLVADALGDFSARDHRMALDYVAGRCGRVVRLADVTGAAPLTRAALMERLATMIDAGGEPIDWTDRLTDHGLDSIRIMELIADWRGEGISLSFEDLAREPTPEHWWSLVEARLPATVARSGAA
ncbi:isochorismatase family protein [Sphingomonas sp. RHCKR7]|uniref:isochorismatase family protein n=1 Tax=Sphingomonas folli TaxID=2862497 RepID=UPI001CA5CE70|nr:isochorismatase family protein [Sphingomonas folli]MBW6528623.1 isochorismatase family protein [Sphingomonas folli]